SPQQTYMQDQAAVQRINAQIDAMLAQPNGGFAVTYYAKPLPPPRERDGRDGRGGEAAQQQPQQKELQPGEVKRDRYGNAEKYVIARAGDTVYATLDRAFNSDDPGAPIFATIHDVDEVGIQGPLDGVRMIGTIHYSTSQGAIQFEKGYLPDGRPLEVKGLAISEDTARTGIAKNVDNHELQRYGTLLFATLVQGVGQVGQVLTQNQQQAMVDPNTGLLVSSQKFNPYEAAAGALLPAGQALTAVAAQQFNRPATISAPAGYGLGIVFLEPMVVPSDLLFARRR
ncbi:MAG: DotG/IcmE/VirB10 family protein, partial [Beijerinckiaceae bacterium]|nr:DotG/IcmE/VirB10 family protein [Beijerinckiaceae bacterium]